MCFALLLASCTLKPTWDLLGKWQKVDGTEVMEFTGEGMMQLTDGPITINTKYKVIGGKELQLEIGSLGSVSLTVSVERNKMTLTNAKGEVFTFNKIR
jgi:hypothetical protein